MRLLDTPRERAQGLVVGLGLVVLVAVAPFAAGLAGALVLYVIFVPLQRRLQRRIPARAAAGLVAATALLTVLVPVVGLTVLAVGRAPHAIEELRDSRLLAGLASMRIGDIAIGAELERASGALVSWISRRGLLLFGSATRAAVNLVVALFGLYYLLVSSERAWQWARDLLPFSPRSADLLRARFRSVTEAMLLGIVLTAAVQGAIVGLGFRIVGLPGAPFWGLVTMFTAVFPLLGAAAVWIPGVLVLLAGHQYGAALALLAIGGGIASTIDNIIRPIIYRRVSHIHPMTTIVGAFAGVAWLGLVGLLIGPLALSYFFELLAIYRREYGDERPAAADAVAPPIPLLASGRPTGARERAGAPPLR